MTGAIEIRARNSKEAIRLEYAILRDKYGEQGVGWKLVSQELRDEGGRTIDVLELDVDGRSVEIRFDVTEALSGKRGVLGALAPLFQLRVLRTGSVVCASLAFAFALFLKATGTAVLYLEETSGGWPETCRYFTGTETASMDARIISMLLRANRADYLQARFFRALSSGPSSTPSAFFIKQCPATIDVGDLYGWRQGSP